MLSQSSTHLQCTPTPGAASFRSRSSGSSTSSLSSTFSDITSSTSASSSSPPTSKTNAFFASPFSTRPPSPAATPPRPQAPRSITADFFATPVRPPSPQLHSVTTVKQSIFHPSRIFPSRYTSTEHRSPDQLHFLDLDGNDNERRTHERNLSLESDSSFTSSFIENRLPTPPPPSSIPPGPPQREDTIVPCQKEDIPDESTPRPPAFEPTLLHFERSLLLAQAQQRVRPEPESLPLEENEREDEVPQPGNLIPLPTSDPSSLPVSPLSMTFTVTAPTSTNQPDDRSTPTPTNDPSLSALFGDNESSAPIAPSSSIRPDDSRNPKDFMPTPTLRLLRSLGHGAFSSVWLAEDLSPVPLTLVSKKSVRDLRRRASGRDRERNLDPQGEEVIAAPEAPKDVQPNGGEKPDKRPQNRLREGLRNILALSPVPIPLLSTSPSNNDNHLSRDSSLKSSPSADACAISRNSSIRSLPSVAGDLSRNSSLRSNPPSRNSSVRLPLSQDTTLSRDSSMKKFRERVRGTRPAFRLGRAYLDERHGEMGELRDAGEGRQGSEDGLSVPDGVSLGASLSRQSSLNKKGNGRLVAVKMTPRKVKGVRGREEEEEERTRVGFVREVEVLKHISHPNITPLLAHLSTSSHHILVLPYLPGGDLLGLVNSDTAWGKLGESVLRRIWCELCKAVGWMHGVGLVHRDIKLENILLTTPTFNSLAETSPRPTLACLPPSPAPFIKLSDFGLSRFVEIDANGDAQLLSTRCGSEAYAAPELVTGGRSAYDARKTDAWSCGVVLYALVGRQLPFGEGVSAESGAQAKIGGERGVGYHGVHASLADRRHWLMRIARGEWTWPGDDTDSVEETPPVAIEADRRMDEEEEELVGLRLVKSTGARRIVSRLLVRETRKRARIGDLWDDPWMCGYEEESWKEFQMLLQEHERHQLRVPSDGSTQSDDLSIQDGQEWSFDDDGEFGDDSRFYDGCTTALPLEDEENDEEEEEEEGGCLLDQEGIDSITRQEVI